MVTMFPFLDTLLDALSRLFTFDPQSPLLDVFPLSSVLLDALSRPMFSLAMRLPCI